MSSITTQAYQERFIFYFSLENRDLTLVKGSNISLTLETHANLKKAMHLIPENTLIGHNDVMPGLAEPRRDPKTPMAGKYYTRVQENDQRTEELTIVSWKLL